MKRFFALGLVLGSVACAPVGGDVFFESPPGTGLGSTYFEPVPGDPLCRREINAATGEVVSVICA